MNSQLSEHISANVPIREGPASMIGSARRSGRTSPAFKKPRGHLLSQSACVKIQVRDTAPRVIVCKLRDFVTDVSPEQIRAWDDSIPRLQVEVGEVLEAGPGAN